MLIEAAMKIKNFFDYYKCINASFYFWKFYYTMIVKKKILKVKSANYINILSY